MSRSPHLRASSLHAMIPAAALGDQSHTLNEDPAERDELETSDTVKKCNWRESHYPRSSRLLPGSLGKAANMIAEARATDGRGVELRCSRRDVCAGSCLDLRGRRDPLFLRHARGVCRGAHRGLSTHHLV